MIICRVNKKIFWLCGLLLFAACGSGGSLSPDAYLQYYGSGRTKKEVTAGTVTYEVRLMSPEAVALRESMDGSKRINRKAVAERMAVLEDNLYFYISIPNAPAGDDAKAALIDYYSREIGSAVKLVTARHAAGISPEYVQYEDNFGLAPTGTLIACFHTDKRTRDEWYRLSFDDVPNGNHAVTVSYAAAFLNDLPALSL